MKRCLFAGLLVIAGMGLGAYLAGPATVRAQTESVVHLTLIETGFSGNHGSAKIPGEIVGFSCATNARSGAPECYVLSR